MTQKLNTLESEYQVAKWIKALESWVYKPCVESKQIRVIWHNELCSMSRKLEQVHVDLWEPHDLTFFRENSYTADLTDDFMRKCKIIFIYMKDLFYDRFKSWYKEVVSESGNWLSNLHINQEREFVSCTLINYCDDHDISLKYSVSYTSEHNLVSKRQWRTIQIIKDLMLLNSELLNNFWAETMTTAVLI